MVIEILQFHKRFSFSVRKRTFIHPYENRDAQSNWAWINVEI